MNDKDIAHSNDRWAKFSTFLEAASKRTGLPGFVIACVALVLTGISLYYVIANYNLQRESVRPALVALSAVISVTGPNTADVAFQSNNSGRGTLRQGTVDLFAASNDEAWQKLGKNDPRPRGY
jgi:hypothetical protein